MDFFIEPFGIRFVLVFDLDQKQSLTHSLDWLVTQVVKNEARLKIMTTDIELPRLPQTLRLVWNLALST